MPEYVVGQRSGKYCEVTINGVTIGCADWVLAIVERGNLRSGHGQIARQSKWPEDPTADHELFDNNPIDLVLFAFKDGPVLAIGKALVTQATTALIDFVTTGEWEVFKRNSAN